MSSASLRFTASQYLQTIFRNKLNLTCTISAFPSPHEAKTAHAQLFMIGYVMVTRDGGGLGESLIGAIIFSVSCKRIIKTRV